MIAAGVVFWAAVFGGWGTATYYPNDAATMLRPGPRGNPEYYNNIRVRRGSMDSISKPSSHAAWEDVREAANDPQLRSAALQGSSAFRKALQERQRKAEGIRREGYLKAREAALAESGDGGAPDRLKYFTIYNIILKHVQYYNINIKLKIQYKYKY